jgi:hypothetical protein
MKNLKMQVILKKPSFPQTIVYNEYPWYCYSLLPGLSNGLFIISCHTQPHSSSPTSKPARRKLSGEEKSAMHGL